MDCKSLTLSWISLSLYKAMVDSYTCSLLPSLCFSGQSEKQDSRPVLWLTEIFSNLPLKPLNEIQGNFARKKISMPSTKFVFFGSIWKPRWPPRSLIDWDIFDFSSETDEQNVRKQNLHVLYQVCAFRGEWKNKNGHPGVSVKEVAHCTQVHDMGPFGSLVLKLVQ